MGDVADCLTNASATLTRSLAAAKPAAGPITAEADSAAQPKPVSRVPGGQAAARAGSASKNAAATSRWALPRIRDSLEDRRPPGRDTNTKTVLNLLLTVNKLRSTLLPNPADYLRAGHAPQQRPE